MGCTHDTYIFLVCIEPLNLTLIDTEVGWPKNSLRTRKQGSFSAIGQRVCRDKRRFVTRFICGGFMSHPFLTFGYCASPTRPHESA